jgi:hypothetical protein
MKFGVQMGGHGEQQVRLEQEKHLGNGAFKQGDFATALQVQAAERVLFNGTRFSNLYTSVDTPARGREVTHL